MKDLLIVELSHAAVLTLYGVGASVLWHNEISGFFASHIIVGIVENALGMLQRINGMNKISHRL